LRTIIVNISILIFFKSLPFIDDKLIKRRAEEKGAEEEAQGGEGEEESTVSERTISCKIIYQSIST